ncbi:3-deoxy-manno-octulosonate cytidylyltransferase [Vibrio chagasii]|nr:3-deoxy-manno-octulosonate cytidylyltransferase [Vibrio chagasii]
MLNNLIVVVPARFGSSRLEGKPLADIHGVPMVVRVASLAIEALPSAYVVVATDNDQISDVCKRNGINVLMTSPQHISGTDRIVEVRGILEAQMGNLDGKIFLNIQGDEPLIPISFVRAFANSAVESINSGDGMFTAATPIKDVDSLLNVNVVKVVKNAQDKAMYFSRAPLCLGRAGMADVTLSPVAHLRHVGVYAYSNKLLYQWSDLPNSITEDNEVLEQLRVLEAGIPIGVKVFHDEIPHGVDTLEDLEHVRRIFKGM